MVGCMAPKALLFLLVGSLVACAALLYTKEPIRAVWRQRRPASLFVSTRWVRSLPHLATALLKGPSSGAPLIAQDSDASISCRDVHFTGIKTRQRVPLSPLTALQHFTSASIA